MRERDRGVGVDLLDDLAQAKLVRRVDKGEKQSHRVGLDARRFQLADDLASRDLVEWLQNLAAIVHALVDLPTEAALGERRGLIPLQVVVVLSVHPLDENDVAKSLRRDQRGARSAPFEQRVGRDGRAVDQRADIGDGQLELVQDAHHAVDGIARRARALRGVELAGLLVDQRQVRERAADVDADAIAWTVAHRSSRPATAARRVYSSRHHTEQNRIGFWSAPGSSTSAARNGIIFPQSVQRGNF